MMNRVDLTRHENFHKKLNNSYKTSTSYLLENYVTNLTRFSTERSIFFHLYTHTSDSWGFVLLAMPIPLGRNPFIDIGSGEPQSSDRKRQQPIDRIGNRIFLLNVSQHKEYRGHIINHGELQLCPKVAIWFMIFHSFDYEVYRFAR